MKITIIIKSKAKLMQNIDTPKEPIFVYTGLR